MYRPVDPTGDLLRRNQRIRRSGEETRPPAQSAPTAYSMSDVSCVSMTRSASLKVLPKRKEAA